MMVNKLTYPKAYREVLEILKYIPQDDFIKIPQYIIEGMKNKADKNYVYKVKYFKNFKKNEMLYETKIILAILYKKYWATKNQKEKILAKEKYDLQNIEKIKKEKYNPDNLFKDTNSKIETTKIETMDSSVKMVEYKESFFTKFIKKLKNIFHIE